MIWHLIPLNDERQHEEKSTCHCDPKVLSAANGGMLVIHNAYDHREVAEKLIEAVNTGNTEVLGPVEDSFPPCKCTCFCCQDKELCDGKCERTDWHDLNDKKFKE